MGKRPGKNGNGPVEELQAGSTRTADYFDQWQTRYHDYYPEGTRLDREYRLSRMLVMSSRNWIHRIDNILRTETGQSRARWQALFALAFAEQPITMTELCRRVHVQWPAMVRVVDGMVEDGLLDREDNPADGRSKLVSLTPAGSEVVGRIKPILDRERSKILARLSDAELEACAKMLELVFEDTTSS